jgi:3-oxoacyl-[acyl-carrier protein] reductase
MAETQPALLSVKDRVVIVTGGGKGIGKVYSERLAEAGAHVVVADIDEKATAETVTAISNAGGKAFAQPTDVSDPDATKRMADAAVQAFGRIDALINNASLMAVLPRRPFTEIPVDEWDRVMQVNLRGVFLCCRAVFPQMQKQGKGKIINISSGRVFEGTPNRLHYTTSKAGVIGLTRALATELGEHNIAVNAITPGFTLSDTQVATAGAYLQRNDHLEGRVFKRHQVPDDLVGTVMFLISDASNFITGQTINVDGGKNKH